jgi:hypothetical protein
MKEISSMDFPQHGEVFYFYGQALERVLFVCVLRQITHLNNDYALD